MGSFIELFGQVTIYHVVIFLMATGYLLEKGKEVYTWITTRHDTIQDKDVALRALSNTVQAQTKDIELLKCANLATLSLHLFSECERVILQGHVTITELDKIKRLYQAYHNLGGNDTGTKLYSDVIVLPLKQKEGP